MKEDFYNNGRLQTSKTFGKDGLLISTYGYW
jgi:hypothetical protein